MRRRRRKETDGLFIFFMVSHDPSALSIPRQLTAQPLSLILPERLCRGVGPGGALALFW